jgi:predicted DsbA family dithiol-disulfide isomerase
VGVVRVIYHTDPACPRSWAAEPALTRMVARFGDGVEVEPVMGGIARRIEALPMLGAVLDAAAQSAMPVDPRLWLEHPPSSSYPACLAVKAAAEQGRAGAYLRRAREGLMCERRKLDTTDALVDLARGVAGLDVARFAIDLASNAIVEAFGADLERTRAVAAGLPFVVVGDAVGEPGEAERLVAAAGAQPGPAPGVEAALRRFGRMATPEVAAACDLPGPRAAAELWRLAAEWRVRCERVLSGELWSVA